jgi:SP family general alpha glucoside:H+ symporter-like MFS transporter
MSFGEEKDEKVHIDMVERAVNENDKVDYVIHDAREATEAEHNMSLLEGIKLYPKAIGWSMLLSSALIMEGYDTALLGSFYAFPAFTKKYGELVPNSNPPSWQLSASWQAALSNGTACGEILGLFAAGIISERIGYRWTIIGALFMVICFVFITFFSSSVQMLLVGEILCGIPWGIFQTLTTTYASEVCPVVLRAYLTTYVNMCWVFGQLIASGVLRSFVNKGPDFEWAYRIPFAIQWVWPPFLIVGVFLAPESPWWLVRRNRPEAAVHSLRRLTNKNNTDFDAEKTVAMMIHTNHVEKEMQAGATYWDLFKGTNLRRTEIASMVWAIQNLCGSTLMGYSTYFYEQAGLAVSFSFDMSIVQYGLGIIGTALSWVFMRYYGRRTLYVLGLSILTVLLFIIGFLALGPKSNTAFGWAIGSLLLVFTFVYDFSVGPAAYSLVPEVASSRMRTKSTVFARNVYNVVGIVNGVITPFMLNPTAWGWGAKTGFFWGGICFLSLVWTYFRLPEPKGRTYGELDVLFERKISARKFSSTKVDPFEVHPTVSLDEIAF